MKNISLILGGARSGKSEYAETLATSTAEEYGLQKLYIATAENRDDEMNARIIKHKQRRGTDWQTFEEPLNIASLIETAQNANSVIMIDCLTLWLSNLMAAEKDINAETERLKNTLEVAECPIILISNEVGLSIVPENALARAFRDEQGLLNQKLAKGATNVVFMAAGLPLILKQA